MMCKSIMKVMSVSPVIRVLAMLVPLLVYSNISKADISIIANKDVSLENLSVEEARKLWLAKIKSIRKSKKLIVVDSTSGSASYSEFYEKIVKKTPHELKIYWGKLMFSGKKFPPKKLYSDADILHWVSSTSGALGYVKTESVDNSVKILLQK